MTDKDIDDKTVANNDESWDYEYTYENQLELVQKDATEVGDYDGTTVRWYVTPMLDENLLLNDGSDYFYTEDGLGSVRELIDTNQTEQNNYDYEAFGSFYGTPTTGVDNNWFTYTGREWDSESQTYYYRARQYHQRLGIFNGRDPEKSINLYTYAINNPIIYTDPLGTQCYSFSHSYYNHLQ